MTSLLRTRLFTVNQFDIVRQKINPHQYKITTQIRSAGHAKWQNIKSTKEANDIAKSQRISRYVMLVKKAIVSNKMQADPKLNSKLAGVLAEAGKFNVPKATLERAIARAKNITAKSVNLEIQGPQGCSIVVRCETENVNNLRRDIKKILRKFDSHLMSEDSVMNIFKSVGYIRTAITTLDGRNVNQDYAEEAAILGNAIEVYPEDEFPDPDGRLVNVWVFVTDVDSLNSCRGLLEKQGLQVLSTDLDLVPYRAIEFGPDTSAKVKELEIALKELEQVIEVYHNVAQ